MKKLLTLAALMFVTVAASAQITWNAKAGLGIATCTGDAEDLSSHLVGKIGVGIEKPISPNWSIMPSLEIAWKGAEYKESEPGYKEDMTLSLTYLQIPVLAAYRINLSDNWNMTIKAGPYIAYALSGEIEDKWESMGVSYKETIDIFKGKESDTGKEEDGVAKGNRFDYGIDLGVDFEYQRFVFGLEYEVGFKSFMKEIDIKNAAGYVTVGYKF